MFLKKTEQVPIVNLLPGDNVESFTDKFSNSICERGQLYKIFIDEVNEFMHLVNSRNSIFAGFYYYGNQRANLSARNREKC